MEFKLLNHANQLNEIDTLSQSVLQVIFKHSTRCSVSSMAKKVLTQELLVNKSGLPDVYYLDLISLRELSNTISQRYAVVHESPQLLIIKDGKCIYHASHSAVSLETGMAAVNAADL